MARAPPACERRTRMSQALITTRPDPGQDAAPRSTAALLVLAGIGAIGVGGRGITSVAGAGRRTAGAVVGPVWRSGPLAPVRNAGHSALAGLAGEGERRAARLVEEAGLDRVVSRLTDGPEIDELIARVLDSPSADRIVAEVLASPGLERHLIQVMESGLASDLTERFLASDELQRVVAQVAQSPAMRAAIAESSASLAGELADEVRTRTVAADDRAERTARRLFRRKPIVRAGPPQPEPGPEPPPPDAVPG